jgi:hypothetical protein
MRLNRRNWRALVEPFQDDPDHKAKLLAKQICKYWDGKWEKMWSLEKPDYPEWDY